MALPNNETLSTARPLAQTLAENRSKGAVLASARALFPPPPLPTWASLRLNWHVRFLWLFLALHLISLYLVWSPLLAWSAFSVADHARMLFAAGANYCLMIGTASAILSQLHAAQLQKYGGTWAIFLAVFFNPLVLGWTVPVYALMQAAGVRRRLNAHAGNVLPFG